MARQFEKTVGVPVRYEMLNVGEWKHNLLLAERYGSGRVFLAGDAVHLVIPTGGLSMNGGVGERNLGASRYASAGRRAPVQPQALAALVTGNPATTA